MSYTQFDPNSKGLEDLKMTSDEVKRFSEAMKKKEFVDMLGDYMDEISDPKNKAEYDEYLKQLERDGELPQGTQLLKPNEGFCIKTTLTQNKNKKCNLLISESQKLFINICSHELIEKSSFEMAKGEKSGQSWRIPYIAGKVRLDQTNGIRFNLDKTICSTVEICFHPEVILMAQSNPAFQKLVCDTAIEGAEKQSKERDEKVSKDYKVMNNLRCKGGNPATLTVRTQFLQNPDKAREWEQQKGSRQKDATTGPKLYQEFMQAQKTREQEKNQEKIQKEHLETQTLEQQEKVQKVRPINAPEYKITYSYPTNYGDFIEAEITKRKLPEYITVVIELPSAEGVGDLKLDIRERLMIFEIPSKHYLEIKLPYDVDQDNGEAKYDKKNKKLRVKLPLSKSQFNLSQIQEKPVKESPVEEIEQHNQNIEANGQEQQMEQTESTDQTQRSQDKSSLLEVQSKPNGILNIYNENPQQKQTVEGPLVQEIVKKEDDDYEIQQPNIKKEEKILNFITQETEEDFFFIFNIPKYNKDFINQLILDDKFLISYEDENTFQYNMINLQKKVNAAESQISLVVDYAVVKLRKLENCFWEKNFFEEQKLDQEQFISIFQEINKKLQEDQNFQLQIQENNKKQESEKQQKQMEEKKAEQDAEEPKQDELEIESKNIIEPQTSQIQDQTLNKINEIASSLQFIEYLDHFVTQLD